MHKRQARHSPVKNRVIIFFFVGRRRLFYFFAYFCLHKSSVYVTMFALFKRPHGQAVKTPPSQGGIRSSILRGATKQVKGEPVPVRRRIRFYHFLLKVKQRSVVFATDRLTILSVYGKPPLCILLRCPYGFNGTTIIFRFFIKLSLFLPLGKFSLRLLRFVKFLYCRQ